ncbi:MAG: DinB family protein [Chloroflexi bacterium]|nr:DinB family protein [Chloroflexota bacterium]
MSNSIAITEVAAGFRFLLTETFESVGGAYLDKGTSLFETLAEISAADASQPMGECATIAAHVAHTTYYLRALEDRMFGRDLSYVNWDQIWDEVSSVSQAEWEAMLADLRGAYQRIMSHLDGAGEWEGRHELSCLLGIIAHSAYHLGEIRQMMCRLKG